MPKSTKRKSTKKATGRPTSGPVTLAEARALAQAEQPKRAVSKPSTADASPEGVGAAREKLRQDRREEIARRVREYKATMAIMKKRGARRPERKSAAKTKGDEPLTDGAVFEPLQILAEGDSWFDYPVPGFGGSIIPRLEDRLGVPILNLAKAGDEVRYMLGVEERTLLTKHLSKGCPAGGPWDVLVFSGGGNDIVGDPMALWIKDWNATVTPSDHIHQARFDAALTLVRAGYEDLIAVRDKLSPNTHLVFHCYDFAIPDGRGICHLGPWLKPTFDLKKFPSVAAATDVVRAMLQQFSLLLESLAASPKVTFINGQGTLLPTTSSWHNELHPSKQGFEKFAGIFHDQLKTIFPDRVA